MFSLWHSSHESAKPQYSLFPERFKGFLGTRRTRVPMGLASLGIRGAVAPGIHARRSFSMAGVEGRSPNGGNLKGVRPIPHGSTARREPAWSANRTRNRRPWQGIHVPHARDAKVSPARASWQAIHATGLGTRRVTAAPPSCAPPLASVPTANACRCPASRSRSSYEVVALIRTACRRKWARSRRGCRRAGRIRRRAGAASFARRPTRASARGSRAGSR